MRTLQGDPEANSKDRNNSLIKQPLAAKLQEYSFVLDIFRNSAESLQTFDGFEFFAKYFKLLFISTTTIYSVFPHEYVVLPKITKGFLIKLNI